MPWKIINTVLDPAKAMRQRTASRMSTEPLVCGRILRVRESMVITDEQYERNKAELDKLDLQGVIDIEPMGDTKAPAPKAEPEPESAPVPDQASEEPVAPPETEPEPEPEPEPEEDDSDAADSDESELTVEAGGAGWYVIRLDSEEVGKVRGKAALRDWFAENGYALPSEFEEQE